MIGQAKAIVQFLVRGSLVAAELAEGATSDHPAYLDVTGFGYQGIRRTFRLFPLPTIAARAPMDFSYGGSGFRRNQALFGTPDPLYSWDTGYVAQSPPFGEADPGRWPEGAPLVGSGRAVQLLKFVGRTNDLEAGRELIIRQEKYLSEPIGARWDKLRVASEAAILAFNTATRLEHRGNVVEYVVIPEPLYVNPAPPAGPGVPSIPAPPPGSSAMGSTGLAPLPVAGSGIQLSPVTELLTNPALVIGIGFAAAVALERLRSGRKA